jgi:hypothetical protein
VDLLTVKPPDFIGVTELVPERTGAERRPDDATWQESSTLPQRAIMLILDAGIAYYGQANQQAAIRRALPFLETDELGIVESLVMNQPLRTVHGFPKRTAKLPVVAIVLGKETAAPGEKYLGDYASGGTDTYGDAGWESMALHSVGFDTILRLLVYSQNADVTIFWYELVKFILIQAREILAKLGIDIPMLNGLDIQVVSKDDAELLYLREIRLQFRTRQVFAEESQLITFLNAFVQEALTLQTAQLTGALSVAQVGLPEPPAPTAEPAPLESVLDDWDARPRAAAGNAPADGSVAIRQTADGPAPYIYNATVREWIRAAWANKITTAILRGVAEGNRDPDLESPAFLKTEAGGTVDPVGGYLEINCPTAGDRASLSATLFSATIMCWTGYVEVTASAFIGATQQHLACSAQARLTAGAAPYVLLNFAHDTDDRAVLVDTSDAPYAGLLGTHARRNLQPAPKWVEVYMPTGAAEDIEVYIDHVLVQRVPVSDVTDVAGSTNCSIGDTAVSSSRRHRLRQVTLAQLAA